MLDLIKNIIDTNTNKNNDLNDDIVTELHKIKEYIYDVIHIHKNNKYQIKQKKILDDYLKTKKITKKEYNELIVIKMTKNHNLCYEKVIDYKCKIRENYNFQYGDLKCICVYNQHGLYEGGCSVQPEFTYTLNNFNVYGEGDFCFKRLFDEIKFKYVKYDNFVKIMIDFCDNWGMRDDMNQCIDYYLGNKYEKN